MNRNLNKTTNEFLEKLDKQHPLNKMGVYNARMFLTNSQISVDYSLDGTTVEFLKDEFGIPCYKISPINVEKENKCFVFCHGGGGTLSYYKDYERMVHDIVLQSGIPCIFPKYSLAPESKYPAQLIEMLDICTSLNEQNIEFALVGNSFGGGLVISVCRRLIELDIYPKCLISMWAMCAPPYYFESYYEYGKDRYLLASDMKWFWHNYTRNTGDFDYDTVTPALNDSQWFEQFPPILVQLAEEDPLHDEGLELFRKIQLAEVDVVGLSYLGTTHDFAFLNQLSNTPAAKQCIEDCCNFLKKHLLLQE